MKEPVESAINEASVYPPHSPAALAPAKRKTLPRPCSPLLLSAAATEAPVSGILTYPHIS